MPTLNWIGKDKVINHHRDVPYKVLEKQYTFSAEAGVENTGVEPERKKKSGKAEKPGFEPAGSTQAGSPLPGRGAGGEGGNMIIHGDNLEALKSLLPQYEGKVKCIYIDPPYNTGNEGWVYNDNVNDPRIKKWLGDVVGKEGEDLSRHDKWLCMMYPRLVLLHKLLAVDGVIFISIDDIEVSSLRCVMDEIFGGHGFISQFIWKSRVSEDVRALTGVSNDHEYVLSYGKSARKRFHGVEKDLTKFTNPDNDPRGPWRSADMTGLATIAQRPNLHYAITDPGTGRSFAAPEKGWRFDQEGVKRRISEGRIIFPSRATGRPRQKIYQYETAETKSLSSVITDYTTMDGTRAVKTIFDQGEFDFPKPPELIELLVSQVADKDSIILDSFAGSGTTAHAVLNLNKQDGGNRKFILIEMMDYADTITAERVKRVMNGYGEGSKKTDGTGGAFDYYTLGEPLFDAQHNLNEAVGVEKIREYIWYSETRSTLQATAQEPNGKKAGGKGSPANPYFLGTHEATAYYFVYEKNDLTTLDHELLATLPTKGRRTLIYADNCLLPKKFMEKHGILFKKIPRDITRF